jgi:hypothetical protein
MLLCVQTEDQSLSSARDATTRQRSAQRRAGPKGAPPAIPPIIITPFHYHTPGPAIDPRRPPPSPPVAPPQRPAMSLLFA